MAGKPSSVTERAINQAIAFLRTAGCTFIIYDSEGEEIANTVPLRKGQKSGIQYKPHFKPLIDALNGEGMIDIVVPDEYDPVKYRGALAGYLHHEFGAGGYITSLNSATRTISVMVVGGAPETENKAEPEKSGVDIDAAHKESGTVTLPIDEPKPRDYLESRPQFRRAPAPLNPVLTSEIVEALQVPDFGKE